MSAPAVDHLAGFAHEAVFYAGRQGFLDATVPFIEAGLSAGEPTLVAVPADRLPGLRAALDGADDELLRFAAMEEMGQNPAWIIPAWADFLAPHLAAGQAVRGIGEPVWAGRDDDELVECAHHEALLNLAFAAAPAFRLLCPYDASALPPEVLAAACQNHPRVTQDGTTATSEGFVSEAPPPEHPLSPVPAGATCVEIGSGPLRPIREAVGARARAAGLPAAKVDNLVLAVSEAVTNTILHGAATGRLAVWDDGRHVVCEVRNKGHIADPLAGRVRPAAEQIGGRGLWLMHQLCDLVQLRTLDDEQVVRLRAAR